MKKDISLSRALYEEIRAQIFDGVYAAGSPLPSTRALAEERSLSRSTVSLVYDQLAADGIIDTHPGAASRVASGVSQLHNLHSSSETSQSKANVRRPGRLSAFGQRVAAMQLRYAPPASPEEIDFVYGPLAGEDFPTLPWMRALRAVEHQRGRRLEYESPLGNLELRRALQAHLSQTRGLTCSLDQILIVNGSQQALHLCAQLLVDPGDQVVVENPGYRMAHHVFASCGAKLVGIGVDSQGLLTGELDRIGQAQMLFVTPTHQFPLGAFLPLARRRELLAWAARMGTWVIEDDYDSEYRYSVRPEQSLWSLDPHGCVIHVGTFSKTLSPQLRLGYMVLPMTLVETFAANKRLADRHAATGVQRALALLIEDGSYARHVGRMRRLQRKRQETLVHALNQYLGERVEIQGAASGLHLVAWLKDLPASAEQALVEEAARRGVRVHPISPLYLPDDPNDHTARPAGLVMGYALLGGAAIHKGVRLLRDAVSQVQQRQHA